MAASRNFQLILIKPSHYDDDGYVIRWWRAMIPSNSLAAVYGIAADCAERQVLGPDVVDRHRRHRRDQHARQHPALLDADSRSTAISAWWRWSACSPTSIRARSTSPGRSAPPAFRSRWAGSMFPAALSMLDGHAVDLDACRELGISMFAGEAEGRFDARAARRRGGRLAAALQLHGRSAGHGRHARAVPAEAAMSSAPSGHSTSFDAGRGCPYQCSFCTIINVQGRKSRFRTADDVEQLVRLQLGAGHQQVLHHRRQFRAQQGMGSDLRPADRAARAAKAFRSA